jgi:hypothetical protein
VYKRYEEIYSEIVKKSAMSIIKVRKYKDSVYVIYTHKMKVFKIFTGAKVEDKYWNICNPKKNCPDLDNIFTQIRSMESRVHSASMKVYSGT